MGRCSANVGYELINEHYDDTMSVLANARNLHAISDIRSVKGWEMAIYRWRRGEKIKTPTETISAPVEKSYYYDNTNDTYVTFLAIAGKMLVIDGEKHREMKTAYSNMIGEELSISEMARKFDMPKAWLEEYKRRHGWTHDMNPYTDEQIQDSNVDDLITDLMNQKKNELHTKFERQKWKTIEKDAEKYQRFEYEVLNEFRQLIPQTDLEVTKLEMVDGSHDYSLVVSPTDFHWGKYGWVDEVGEKYDFEEAKKRLMEKTSELITRLPSRPEQIILSTGSDWFHVDTDTGTTTRGTPQDMCGSPAEILMTGCQMAREHIDLLRQVAPVKVVFMPGNHDRMSAIALMMYLSAVYENVDDCEVVVSPSTRQYVEYGNNLLGFIHGDGAKNLVELMSCEKRELWGKCEHHIWFHGHLHHRKLTENKGAMIVQLPSLAGHDRYHARQGYTTSKAGLAAHIIDKEKGLIGSLFAPVVEH
jgi:hypothetical protein